MTGYLAKIVLGQIDRILYKITLKKLWNPVLLNVYNGLPLHLMWIRYITSFAIL